jgi:hypothetical protein
MTTGSKGTDDDSSGLSSLTRSASRYCAAAQQGYLLGLEKQLTPPGHYRTAAPEIPWGRKTHKAIRELANPGNDAQSPGPHHP